MRAWVRKARARRGRFLDRRLPSLLRSAYASASLPVVVVMLFHGNRIDPAYGMTWSRMFRLARRMRRTTTGVFTATSYKAHLAMAIKLMEIPPTVQGVVVECGCFLGGSTANLSLVCEIVGRELYVYDSFEGMPPESPNDKYAVAGGTGNLRGDLDVVQDTVRRFGVIERCTFVKGWFKDTLPDHEPPVVLCFLDVDYQASLHDCVQHLWPKLSERGYMFIDEYVLVDYCALFYSERYWREYFDSKPPGLIGAGSGVGIGQYYLGPYRDRRPIQGPMSVAYTRRDFTGVWEYFPDHQVSEPAAGR
jgi:hypothetical protein